MGKFIYYIIIIPLSRLPFAILYRISDFMYYMVYYILAYRKKVVLKNLKLSFPDLTIQEHKRIAKKFYRHLCDILVETIKVFSISEKEAKKRFNFSNPDILIPYAKKNQNILLVAGHYNNWEMGGIMANQLGAYHSNVLITPIKDPFLHKKFQASRARFGVSLIPKTALRKLLKSKTKIAQIIILLADQSPTYSRRVIRLKFLHQDTAVTLGPEWIARNYNYPVFWVSVRKIQRGHYRARFELITDTPQATNKGEITKKYTNLLQTQILEHPEYWLWTHRRWKLNKAYTV